MLIDSFGTLVAMAPPHVRLRSLLAEAAGVDVPDELAAAAFRAEIDHYVAHHLEGRDAESLDRLRDDCAAVLHDALGHAAAGVERSVVRRAMLDSIRFDSYADAVPALQWLRRGGLLLVVASNWDCSLRQVLYDAGLLDLVDSVVPSALAGAAKPDPALFETALGSVGCSPAEALHVGDSVDNDVAGAIVAGVAPVLIARDGGGRAPAVPPGTPVVRSLVELAAALAAGGRMLGAR